VVFIERTRYRAQAEEKTNEVMNSQKSILPPELAATAHPILVINNASLMQKPMKYLEGPDLPRLVYL